MSSDISGLFYNYFHHIFFHTTPLWYGLRLCTSQFRQFTLSYLCCGV